MARVRVASFSVLAALVTLVAICACSSKNGTDGVSCNETKVENKNGIFTYTNIHRTCADGSCQACCRTCHAPSGTCKTSCVECSGECTMPVVEPPAEGQEGAPCDAATVCASGLRCRPEDQGGLSSSKCLKPAAEGEGCRLDGNDCASGLTCKSSAGSSETGICKGQAGLCAGCSMDSDCGTLFSCSSGTCVYKSRFAGACKSDDDCTAPYLCSPTGCFAPQCAGGLCQRDENCAPPLTCQKGTGESVGTCH